MADVTDQTLLRTLAAGDDPEALGELAVRYGGLVYSSALKQVRDPHLAEDITQAVFIVLMRKARSIHPDTVLASWLFTVTRHAVQNARRMQARRRHHEMQVAGMFREAQVEESDADDRIPQTLLLEAISAIVGDRAKRGAAAVFREAIASGIGGDAVVIGRSVAKTPAAGVGQDAAVSGRAGSELPAG